MFVIRRVWTVEPGEARRAATIVAAIGDAYEAAGKRGPSRVYFNNGTMPGERYRVYMEWIEEEIASTYRKDIVESPPEAIALREKLGELTTESWIEFHELLTPEKAMEID